MPAIATLDQSATPTAPKTTPVAAQKPLINPVPALPSPASIPALPGPVSAAPSNMGTQTPTITDPYGTGGQKNAQGQYTPAQPYTNPVPNLPAPSSITPPPISDAGGMTPGYTAQNPTLTATPATSGGAFSYKDPTSGLTLQPGSGAMAGKLTFTDPASGKTYYSMGAGGGWEEVGTNAAYTGKAPDIGATLNATGNITSTPGGAYDQFTQFLAQPGNTNIKDAQAAQAAIPQAASAYNPGDVATLQNGVASVNGKVTGLTNASGGIVDPATGQLSNAGGIVAAQGSNATNGVPGNVNGTPINDYLTSLGIGPMSGSAISGGAAGATPGTTLATNTPDAVVKELEGAGMPASQAPGGTGVSGAGTQIGTSVPVGSTSTSGTGSQGSSTATIPIASPGQAQSVQDLLATATGQLGSVDRNALAQSQFSQFTNETDPAYQAAIRSATQAAAGAGRIGSGMLRTDYGNLALNRTQQLQNAQADYMNTALSGSIQDTKDKVAQLESLQAQNFGQNNTLDQEAIANALQQYQQELAAQQQQFSQGVTLTQLGNENNPANYYAQAAAALGSNASQSDIAALAKQMASGNSALPSPGTVALPPGVTQSPTTYSGGTTSNGGLVS